VRELEAGLWHWQAAHPDWTPGQPWPQEVSSYAIDDGAQLLLFDPLSVPDELLELAADREPVVVLTAPWHERDTRILVQRLGAPVFAPPPDTAQDLMAKYGVTAEQAGDGSPDLAWLPEANFGRLPDRIVAVAGREHNDLVLWIEDRRVIVAGDTLVDLGSGLQVNPWLRGGVTREAVLARLRPLLDQPVELVLPAHGAPTDRAALEGALS
jgi:glyoxylase-like metal-dependent hydrolase (beta-lactamase superfamily II)